MADTRNMEAQPPSSPRVTPIGIVFISILAITGWLAVALVMTPLLLLALIPIPEISNVVQPLYARGVQLGGKSWFTMCVCMLEWMYNIKVAVTGDPATKSKEAVMLTERAFWLSNHRTRIDWMLLWCLGTRTGSLDRLKIVLKDQLRSIPIFGWAMQHMSFIFLRREWAKDEMILEQSLPAITTREPRSSYLMFPEGTDLSESNVLKSQTFAQKHGNAGRYYTLYPRTTGWTFIFPKLRDTLDAVYDITMFYVDHAPNERPSELSLLSGRMCRMIHFHVERFDVKSLPKDKEGLGTWLEQRYTIKEANLKVFYEQDHKLPPNAEVMLSKDKTPSFILALIGWFVSITITAKWAWQWGWLSIAYILAVSVFHMVAMMGFGGVDGIIRRNFYVRPVVQTIALKEK